MFGQTSKAKILLLSVATLLLTTGFNAVFPAANVSADVKSTPYIKDVYVDSVYKKLSANQHYWWLYSCFQNVDIDKVTKAEVDGWDFFQGSGAMGALGAMYSPSDNGYYRECSTGSVVETAFNYLGFKNSRETFCSIEGAQYKDDHDGDYSDCVAGAGGHDWDNGATPNEIIKWYKEKVEPKKPAISNPEFYMRAFTSMVEGCDMKFPNDTLYPNEGAVPGAASSSTQYAVPVVVKQGGKLVTRYVQGVGKQSSTPVIFVATTGSAGVGARLPAQTDTCGELVEQARNYVNAYRAVAEREGVTSAPDAPGGEETEETTCGIDGIGWIVCPVMTFMAKLNDSAFGFLDGFLAIRPALINDEATLKAWSAFRDIANVAFIVAFLLIVYSQLTSIGLSNYGVKKMLPRIFVSAILVNLSYFICAIAVDLSNIVGSSAYSLLGTSIPVGTDGATNGAFANGWQDVVGPALAAAATGVAILVVVGSALPAVLLALALILFILIARQALVIMLLVVAPLAFVAFLLPNTESWFKKWRQAFVTVLMVYPIIGVIFGASTLAANILIGVSNDDLGNSNDEQLLKVVALGALAIPLFAVPIALKGSLSAAGAIGAKLSNLADRTNRTATGQMKERTAQKMRGLRDATAIAATNRSGIFGGKSKVGRAFGATGGYLAQRKAKREQLYNTLGRRRAAVSEMALNTNEKTAARERKAIAAEESTGLAKEANKNQAKIQHIRDPANHGAYNAAQQSGMELHDEEAIHKADATKTYLGNTQNVARRTSAVQAGASASNVEETVKNNAVAGYMNSAANAEQYSDLNASKGEAKNAQLKVEKQFEGSAVGLNQALERKATEGQLDIMRSEQKAAFDATATGINQAVLKDASTKRQMMASAAGEAAAIADNTDIRVAAQAAQDEIEVAKASESAYISELRTEAGAQKNLVSQQSQELQDSVTRLQAADTQRRVQAQRTTSAQGVATVEYAKQVAASENVPGGLAEIAGGVDEYGARRAVTAAQQVEIEQFIKNVKSEQTTMSMINPTKDIPATSTEPAIPSLRSIALDSNQSVERRAAATGQFMKEAPMAELHKFIDEVGSIPDTLPGGKEGEGAVARKNMLMQLSADMNRIPFALGDGARSAIRRGEYTTDQFGTHEQQLIKRVQEKISGDTWRGMDPDDRRAISKIASTPEGQQLLGATGRNNLLEAFNDINNTPTVRASTKTDARKTANDVARNLGFALPFPENDTP